MADLRELLYRVTAPTGGTLANWDREKALKEAREIGLTWKHEQEQRKLLAAPGFDLVSLAEEVSPIDFGGQRVRKITIFERMVKSSGSPR